MSNTSARRRRAHARRDRGVMGGEEELGATAIMLVHEATCFLPAALQPCVICVCMQRHGPTGGGEGHCIRPL